MFISHLFTNRLHKRSNGTAGKSTESEIMNTREAAGVRINNEEVRGAGVGQPVKCLTLDSAQVTILEL